MLVHLLWLVRALFRLSMRLSGSDEASLEQKLVRAGMRLGEADHQVLSIPEIRKAFAQATAESFRQAADASTKDGLVYSRPWGLEDRSDHLREPVPVARGAGSGYAGGCGPAPFAGLAALHRDLLSR